MSGLVLLRPEKKEFNKDGNILSPPSASPLFSRLGISSSPSRPPPHNHILLWSLFLVYEARGAFSKPKTAPHMSRGWRLWHLTALGWKFSWAKRGNAEDGRVSWSFNFLNKLQESCYLVSDGNTTTYDHQPNVKVFQKPYKKLASRWGAKFALLSR